MSADNEQEAEKVRWLHSRIVQTLNVPLRVRLGPSLAAALLDGLFEQPMQSRRTDPCQEAIRRQLILLRGINHEGDGSRAHSGCGNCPATAS